MKLFTTQSAIAMATVFATLQAPLWAQKHPQCRLNKLFSPNRHDVYVAAHRGDWRNAPENSVQALQCAETLDVDIVEFDVKRTKDGQLVVMHDRTLNRTTTGSGQVSDYTLNELRQLRLRAGTGHPTLHLIPTLSEELSAAKNRVMIDIDQGWDYVPEVLQQLRESGTIGQAIVNTRPNTALDVFEAEQGPIPEDLALMVVVDMSRPDVTDVIKSYRKHKRTVIQCIFASDDLISVQDVSAFQQAAPIWINSLWPDQNGNHDDDRAVEQHQPEQSWGWLISHGADLIQTDRPEELIAYLREKHLHD